MADGYIDRAERYEREAAVMLKLAWEALENYGAGEYEAREAADLIARARAERTHAAEAQARA